MTVYANSLDTLPNEPLHNRLSILYTSNRGHISAFLAPTFTALVAQTTNPSTETLEDIAASENKCLSLGGVVISITEIY